jgi:hypothetical protein
MLNLKSAFQRTGTILDKEGLSSLLKRAYKFIAHRIYTNETFYLIENSIEKMEANPDDFVPDILDLHFRFVKTNQEADKVAQEFSDFRLSHLNAREMLDKGAMALCIFIGAELAYINWTAATEASKNTFNNLPFKVNFANKEVVAGGESTEPKYRRKGLSKYGHLLKDRFLKEMGVTKKHAAISENNLISMKAKAGYGNKVYAKGNYKMILGWKSWQETPISPPKPVNQMIMGNK